MKMSKLMLGTMSVICAGAVTACCSFFSGGSCEFEGIQALPSNTIFAVHVNGEALKNEWNQALEITDNTTATQKQEIENLKSTIREFQDKLSKDHQCELIRHIFENQYVIMAIPFSRDIRMVDVLAVEENKRILAENATQPDADVVVESNEESEDFYEDFDGMLAPKTIPQERITSLNLALVMTCADSSLPERTLNDFKNMLAADTEAKARITERTDGTLKWIELSYGTGEPTYTICDTEICISQMGTLETPIAVYAQGNKFIISGLAPHAALKVTSGTAEESLADIGLDVSPTASVSYILNTRALNQKIKAELAAVAGGKDAQSPMEILPAKTFWDYAQKTYNITDSMFNFDTIDGIVGWYEEKTYTNEFRFNGKLTPTVNAIVQPKLQWNTPKFININATKTIALTRIDINAIYKDVVAKFNIPTEFIAENIELADQTDADILGLFTGVAGKVDFRDSQAPEIFFLGINDARKVQALLESLIKKDLIAVDSQFTTSKPKVSHYRVATETEEQMEFAITKDFLCVISSTNENAKPFTFKNVPKAKRLSTYTETYPNAASLFITQDNVARELSDMDLSDDLINKAIAEACQGKLSAEDLEFVKKIILSYVHVQKSTVTPGEKKNAPYMITVCELFKNVFRIKSTFSDK